eukprot:1151490-Pelagomonas_calceolata.AAC.2
MKATIDVGHPLGVLDTEASLLPPALNVQLQKYSSRALAHSLDLAGNLRKREVCGMYIWNWLTLGDVSIGAGHAPE